MALSTPARRWLKSYLDSNEKGEEIADAIDASTESIEVIEADLEDLRTILLSLVLDILESSDATVNVGISDGIVLLTGTGQTVVLPDGSSHSTGRLTIKDKAGNATTSPVTVNGSGSDTIDGQATLVLDSNYVAITLIFNAGEWSVT